MTTARRKPLTLVVLQDATEYAAVTLAISTMMGKFAQPMQWVADPHSPVVMEPGSELKVRFFKRPKRIVVTLR